MRKAPASTPPVKRRAVQRVRDLDWLLSLVSIAGACASAFLLSRPTVTAEDDAPAVAALSFAHREVRRRASRTLVWEELSTGAVVHDRDTVFVPPGAEAQVTFLDGTLLEVDENSLVVIEAPRRVQGASPRVALKKGSLSGTTSTGGVEIESGQGVTSLAQNTEARVELSSRCEKGQPGCSDGARIDVFSGSATVATSKGREQLSPERSAALGEDGRLALTQPLVVELLLPARNTRLFFTGAPSPVDLRWSTRELPADATLEVARDRAFGFIVHSGPAREGYVALQRKEAGVYWWRIVGADGAPVSEARRFTLVEDLPPRLLSPKSQEIVLATAEKPVPFHWSLVKSAAQYRLEVAASEDFSTPLQVATAETHQLRLPVELPEGIYFWRVRAENPMQGASTFSRPTAFRLIHKALPEAPVPVGSEIEVDPEGSGTP